jgi:hypothetical protein
MQLARRCVRSTLLRQGVLPLALATIAALPARGQGLDFHTVAPCRVYDSRTADGPFLQGVKYSDQANSGGIAIVGACDVPTGATAVALNVTIVGATGAGELVIFPMGASPPAVAALSFVAGRTRAGLGLVPLGPGGAVDFSATMTPSSPGLYHLVLDVSGYFIDARSASDDSDGDGLLDAQETAAIPPTDPDDPDSDDDGMMDGDENLVVTLAATGYNLSTDSTYAIDFTNIDVNLSTTFEDDNGDGAADGYDTDVDGLSDTFEMYWYRSTSFVQGIHPLHTAFSGPMESCAYALTGSQPLHPDDADVDDDGLLDGHECNVYATNPFSAVNEGPIFDKVTNSSFLGGVVFPALRGDLEAAAIGARSLGLTVGSTDGLITVAIVRAIDPSSPGGSGRYLIGTFIASVCGDTAYANVADVVTVYTNECGEMVGSEPPGTNNDLAAPVIVRIPMSEFFTVLSSGMINTMTPQ